MYSFIDLTGPVAICWAFILSSLPSEWLPCFPEQPTLCWAVYLLCTMKSTLSLLQMRCEVTGTEVRFSLSWLLILFKVVGNTGGRAVQGRVPFWICGLGWDTLPDSCEWLWNSPQQRLLAYLISLMLSIYLIFIKNYYFQITDKKPAIFPHVRPPYLYPYHSGHILIHNIYTILSPSLIPSSFHPLMLLVSFHPRCPHPALILSFAWTNWLPASGPPACDLQTATRLWHVCTHTYAVYHPASH